MPNSKRYIFLVKRVNIIESFYLPLASPTGDYTNKQEDDMRAYLLLVHAEIESYFEEICEEKLKKAFKIWVTKRTKSNVLLSLTSFCESNIKNDNLEDRINDALTSQIKKLKDNNGIKQKNILSMVLPLGIELSNLDMTWLSVMNTFGAARGDVAHKTAAVQQQLDPQTLKATVTLIMNEIQKIDIQIKSLI
jgi:hypothetical protein